MSLRVHKLIEALNAKKVVPPIPNEDFRDTLESLQQDNSQDLIDSVKFDLGGYKDLPRDLDITFPDKSAFRLPYPKTLFQIKIGDVYHYLLCREAQYEGEDGIGLYPYDEYPKEKQFVDYGIYIFIGPEEHKLFSYVDYTKYDPDMEALDIESTSDSVSIVVTVLKILECSNVSESNNIPPAKLNKKRNKKGKLLLFEYKTLVITGGGNSSGSHQGGTHASPRLHMRRGHIRRLRTTTVWVRSCMVGDPTKGRILKDYKLNPKGKPDLSPQP